MKKSMRYIFTLAGRNFKEILRDPLGIIFTLAMPLIMEVAFYFLFGKMTAQFQMKYLAPGIIVFSQAFLTLFTGLVLSVDRSSSFLTRLYVSGAKPFDFIAGYALSVLPIVLFQSVLFFAVGIIIDGTLLSVTIIPTIALSLLTSLTFVSAGILLGSICNEKSIGGVASVVIAGQSVLSGMWFPIDGLSGGFLTVMNVLPFRNATLLLQNAFNGATDTFDGIIKPLLIVLAYTVAIFLSAVIAFGKKMIDN